MARAPERRAVTSYEEYQERDGNIVYYNKYDIGTSFVASITMNF